jgi:hypothetical protein
MPRLSLWRENKTNDYKFIDRRISEMFTIGGTGILLHKYIGPDLGNSTGGNPTLPTGAQSPLSIQDVLFIENRDRKYDTSVYSLRGIYQKQDQDFDLSQFGIFLAAGTTFMTFHLNDTIELLGRKPIAGDVLEFMHMRDFYNLDESIPFAIRKFYVITDVAFASEGFSPTWWPHLWRVKLTPLVDSQEYKDILNHIAASDDPFAANATVANVGSVTSTYSKYLIINEEIIAEAEIQVPKSGYNTDIFYTPAYNDDGTLANATIYNPAPITIDAAAVNVDGSYRYDLTVTSNSVDSNQVFVANSFVAIVGSRVSSPNVSIPVGTFVTAIVSNVQLTLSQNVSILTNNIISVSMNAVSINSNVTADSTVPSPTYKVEGYLSGDGTAPNGLNVNMGISFPSSAKSGDFFLRLDYAPNRLFRFDGKRWVKIEDDVRTNLTPGAANNATQLSSFVNNTKTFRNMEGQTVAERVGLSQVLSPKADN